MELIIIFLIFKIFFCKEIIPINSFETYQIPSNQKEIIFLYNYSSYNKTDMIIFISPNSEEKILGELYISTSLELVLNKTQNEKVKKMQLNYDSKQSIVINQYDPVNIGKYKYYISLYGNIACTFEIFLSNEKIKIFSIKSYFFPKIFNMTSSYLSFELNIDDNEIFINILKNNKSCDIIKLYKNNEEMSCNEEISEYTLLKKYYKYSMKIFYDYNNSDEFAINFLTNIIQDLITYKNNLLFIDNSEFYFLLDCQFYTMNSNIGISSNYDSKCEFEIYYLEYINENTIPDKETINAFNYLEFKNQNSFLLNYYNESLRYILITVKIMNNKNTPLKIEAYNNIYFINEIPFNFHIESEKYFFIVTEELKSKYYETENLILLKFNSPNNMIIYTLNNDNKISREEIYYDTIDSLVSICFDNIIEGDFEINPLPLEMNKKIINYNDNDFNNNKEQYMVFSEDKNELTEIIVSNSEKIIYLNLIIGNCSFYFINNINYSFNDLKEIPDEDKKIINGIEVVNTSMSILKYKINSFSIFECFIQKNDNLDNNFLYEPTIKYFRNKLIYEIDFIFSDKILVKLLTPDKNVTLYNNHSEFFLNSENLIIYLTQSGKHFFKGQNSLVAFYTLLTENNNYSICDKDNTVFYNAKEIFIIPNVTNYTSIIIYITCLDDKQDYYLLNYLIDYNIIPFTRKNEYEFQGLPLKKGEKTSLLIKNFYKGNKIINNIDKETLFAYIMFDTYINKINIEIKYTNNLFINRNEYLLLEPGINQLFLGYEYNYFVKLNLCNNKEIGYFFNKDEILNESKYNIITSDEILHLKNDNIDDHYNIYINNEKELLISFTNDDIRDNISELNYNYDINMKYFSIENKEIYFEFYPISSYAQVEYSIFLFDSKDFIDKENLCNIFYLINNKAYEYKEVIISNNDELVMNKYINFSNIYQSGKDYILLIMAKELLNSFPNYRFYNPYNLIFSDTDDGEIDNNNNISNSMIILIIIGVLISLILIAVSTFLFVKKRKCKRQNISEDLERISLLKEDKEIIKNE